MKIGVLALQGDVFEHIKATKEAAKNLKIKCEIVEVRKKEQLKGLDGLILPGGESTTFWMLLERAKMFDEIKKIRKLFGTCAGAIMLAKSIKGAYPGQKSLKLMDLTVKRNAIWPQVNSCECEIDSKLGKVNAIFIRAPAFVSLGKNVKVLAKLGGKPVAIYEEIGKQKFLALTFHPELTTSKFHEYFLKM